MSTPGTVINRPVRSHIVELAAMSSWINLVVGSILQVVTYPGRVYGLGVITEPLIHDIGITRTEWGEINFWATMVVAILSFGYGTVIDRLGIYRSCIVFTILTALGTMGTGLAYGYWSLFVVITLNRLFGQGILAIVSTALLGKSFSADRSPITGTFYVILMAVILVGLSYGQKVALVEQGMNWRQLWFILGAIMVLVVLPLTIAFVTEPKIPPPDRAAIATGSTGDKTVWQAIRSPLFIVYGSFCMTSGISWSGIALFNESLLKDRGFSKEIFFDSLILGAVAIAVFKFGIAWACRKWMGLMLTLGMLIYAASLFAIPYLETETDVYAWTLLKALAGAIQSVVYFCIWVYAFGRRDLAQVQGAAHVITITASGIGPLVFAYYRDHYGSYIPCLEINAWAALVLGLFMFFVPVRCAEPPVNAEDNEAE